MKARIMITAFALASAALTIVAIVPLSRAWN
jgi:hypothetical protein